MQKRPIFPSHHPLQSKIQESATGRMAARLAAIRENAGAVVIALPSSSPCRNAGNGASTHRYWLASLCRNAGSPTLGVLLGVSGRIFPKPRSAPHDAAANGVNDSFTPEPTLAGWMAQNRAMYHLNTQPRFSSRLHLRFRPAPAGRIQSLGIRHWLSDHGADHSTTEND